MINPLVSIGIPTYNRPEGLRRTLNRITNQTYKNLEIIVSDNCSPNKSTELLVKELMKTDYRIKYFKQERNMGVTFNFHFVLSKASANYFMWATDDDYFESSDLIEKLLKFAQDNLLTFTNYNFTNEDKVSYNHLTPIFDSCKKKIDYIYAFCKCEYGHPSTGMFNLNLLKKSGISLRLSEDLSYHMEGLLLHNIFYDGRVKYVDDVLINFNTKSRESSSISPSKWASDFIIYTNRVLLFYLFKARLIKFKDRIRLISILLDNHKKVYSQIISYMGTREVTLVGFCIRLLLMGNRLMYKILHNIKQKLMKLIKSGFKILLLKPLSLLGLKINRIPSKKTIKINQELQRQEYLKRNLWLINLKIKTVLDIGANTGQFAAKILDLFPDIDLYCFEPIIDCFKELENNLGSNKKVKFFNFALGNENGGQTIHINEYSPSSSLLEMNNLHKKAFAFTEKSAPGKILIKKLDEIGRAHV
jgi:FkbM family methyltransferase